jgi:hypothetical protein
MDCRCDTVAELYGNEAEDYAGDHLRREEANAAQFNETFSCPDTGARWLLDYPERSERDPGQARLVREPR